MRRTREGRPFGQPTRASPARSWGKAALSSVEECGSVTGLYGRACCQRTLPWPPGGTPTRTARPRYGYGLRGTHRGAQGGTTARHGSPYLARYQDKRLTNQNKNRKDKFLTEVDRIDVDLATREPPPGTLVAYDRAAILATAAGASLDGTLRARRGISRSIPGAPPPGLRYRHSKNPTSRTAARLVLFERATAIAQKLNCSLDVTGSSPTRPRGTNIGYRFEGRVQNLARAAREDMRGAAVASSFCAPTPGLMTASIRDRSPSRRRAR